MSADQLVLVDRGAEPAGGGQRWRSPHAYWSTTVAFSQVVVLPVGSGSRVRRRLGSLRWMSSPQPSGTSPAGDGMWARNRSVVDVDDAASAVSSSACSATRAAASLCP